MKLMALLMMVTGTLASGVVYAQSADDLLKSKNCLNCHELDKKKVGPAFKDVAAKYKGNKDAEAKIIEELKEGKGHPIKIAASDAELKTLVHHVLSLK